MRVIGRDAEIQAINRFLEDLGPDGRWPRVLLLTGEAGIGKTVLWDEGRSAARRRGNVVLSARPVESEDALGFAALGDLFADVDAAAIDTLPAPQRQALLVALLRVEAGDAPPDPRSVGTAALGVLRALSRERPLVIAVDDLGWLDPNTKRVLAFALRRLTDDPVRVLATVRSERGQLPRLPTDDLGVDRAQHLNPRALSVGAVRELLADRLAFTPSRRVLVQIQATSGGNPYLAIELARALEGVDPSHIGDELPVPKTLRRLVHRQVARMPAGVRAVLLGAALAPGSAPDVITAAAPDPSSASGQLTVAARAAIIDVTPGDVTFTHPLLRSVVIDDASVDEVRDAHGRLAEAVTDPVARTRHRALAAAEPSEDIARALDDAARELHRRGASDTAADLAELAITMTPAGPPDAWRQRVLEAAEYRFTCSDPTRARELVAGVVEREKPGPERAAVLVQLAKYERYSGAPLPAWTATLQRALADTATDAPALQLAIHFLLGFVAIHGGNAADAPMHVQAVSELADSVDDGVLDGRAAAAAAYVKFLRGEGLRRDLVDKALSNEPAIRPTAVEETSSFPLAVALVHAGETTAARNLLERDVADAVSRGDESGLPLLLWLLIRLETWAGNWARADLLIEQGMAAAELVANPVAASIIQAVRATTAAIRGRVDQARDDATSAGALAAGTGQRLPEQVAAEAIGILELSLGNAAAARDAVVPVLDQSIRSGIAEPRVLRLHPLAVEALVRTRQFPAARAYLDLLTEHAGRAPGTWTEATARRCHAMVLAAAGDLSAAESELALSLHCTAGLATPFEHARTLLVAGEIQRRGRHRRLAQDSVLQAKALFDDLGAALWAERCSDELARIAGRSRTAAPGPGDTLTDAERRVAELAAAGHTTREIAAALFTGVRTVEAHLHRVYHKLGVRSRVELSRIMSERGGASSS